MYLMNRICRLYVRNWRMFHIEADYSLTEADSNRRHVSEAAIWAMPIDVPNGCVPFRQPNKFTAAMPPFLCVGQDGGIAARGVWRSTAKPASPRMERREPRLPRFAAHSHVPLQVVRQLS